MKDVGWTRRSKNNMSQIPTPDLTTRSFSRATTASSQKSTASVHDTDYRETLEQYNVFVPGKALPTEIKQEVEEWVFRVRESPDLDDAFIEHLKEITKGLQNKGEEEVRNQLGVQVIPCYSTPPDKRMEVSHGHLWSKTVPVSLDKTVLEPPLPLPKPKPDTTFGYAKAAFSRSQLATINLLVQAPNGPSFASPGQDIRFPFGVVEYKSQAKDGSIRVATNQAAGAGAVALNGFLDLMSRDPSLAEIDIKKALFFSVTMDQNIACVNVEWVDKTPDTDQYSFHLEELSVLPLRYGDSIRVLRRVLKNIYDYALDERLKFILDLLDMYRDDITRQKDMDSEETLQAEVELHAPPTPPRPRKSKKARSAASEEHEAVTEQRTQSKQNMKPRADVQRSGVRTRRATKLAESQ